MARWRFGVAQESVKPSEKSVNTNEKKYPGVGVAVIVVLDYKVLVLKTKGSSGSGKIF